MVIAARTVARCAHCLPLAGQHLHIAALEPPMPDEAIFVHVATSSPRLSTPFRTD
jgi:hypothetical protein